MANFNNFFYKAVRLIGNYVSLSNDVAFREDPSEYKNRFNFDTVKKLETVDGCNEVIDDLKKEMEYYSSKNGKKDKERVELAKELIRTILLIHGNNAKVNESMENPKYKAYAYFGSNFSGLDSDLESDDWMEIEDFCHDMLMQGNYCEIQNNESGKSVRITPDEYIDTFDGEFLYRASDLEESIKEDANGKEIKRYSDVYSDDVKQRGWWYFTTHGVMPGSIPKDLNVLEVRDGKNNKGTMGTFVRLDGILNTSELKEFDMKEMSPIDEAIGDFAYERQLLGRLKADCDYVLDTCVGENGMSLESSQKHLWAGSTGNQIAKMRELHQLSADMDSVVTDADIDEYERRFKDAWSKEDVSESLKEADLNERNLTRAERHNKNMNKIFSYKRATDDAMKKYLIKNGVSEDEAEKLFQDDKLDVKLRELGLHDDFFDMWNKKKYDYDKSGEFYLIPENLVEADSAPKYTVYKQFGDYYVTEYDNYHSRISNARKNRKLNGFESAEEVVDYLLRNNWVNSRDELEVLTESKSKKTESVLKNKRTTLKEAKQWSTKYPQYEYEFDDGIKITAADETEAREKYQDIIENRYTGVRSKDDIDNLAQQLYDSGDEWSFNYFSDEELAMLWALCSLDTFGRAYDDEVYEAIYTQPEPQKIFKKAQKYYNKYNVQSEVTLHEDKEDDDFETLKATVKNMTNDFKDAEGDLSDFYMTWNFGYNNDGFVTGGIDIRMNDRNDLDKAEEAKKKVEAIFAKNGFELDKAFPKNPGKTLFGGIHYQIISKDKILSESLKEGAEGRKEPGFEFVILDMTDKKNPTVVAKRTTKVEAEWAALKMSGRAYGHKGMKKFDGKELEVQKAPVGEYKIGDIIDLDDYPYYNESLKEGYGEYITLELADKTNRKIIKDLYDRNELSIVQRGDCWYTEDCPARYFKIVKEEMKKYFPKLSYLYDAQPYKSQLEKSIMRKLSNESLKEAYFEKDLSDIPLVDRLNFVNNKRNSMPNISSMKDFISALNGIGLDEFKVRSNRFGSNLSEADLKDAWMDIRRNGWSVSRCIDNSLDGFNEVYLCKKINVNESLKESASDGDFLVKYEAVIYDDNLENFDVLEVVGERTVTKEQVIKKFPFTQKGFDWMTKEDWEEWGSDEHYDESLSSYIFRASGLNNDPICKKRFREIVEENPEEDNLFARYEVETLNPDVFKSRVKKMSTFLGKKLLSRNESLNESSDALRILGISFSLDNAYSFEENSLIRNTASGKKVIERKRPYRVSKRYNLYIDSFPRAALPFSNYFVADKETGKVYRCGDVPLNMGYSESFIKPFVEWMRKGEDLTNAPKNSYGQEPVKYDFNPLLDEDTIKTKDGKWTNKGDEGTHGKFKTKKEADAQRRAMFAGGFKESLKEKLNLNDYDDCWVEFRDGEPNFCYDTYLDAYKGVISSRMGDYQYDMGNHEYYIKRWEGGKLYDVDKNGNVRRKQTRDRTDVIDSDYDDSHKPWEEVKKEIISKYEKKGYKNVSVKRAKTDTKGLRSYYVYGNK